jgi:hypothetical protein
VTTISDNGATVSIGSLEEKFVLFIDSHLNKIGDSIQLIWTDYLAMLVVLAFNVCCQTRFEMNELWKEIIPFVGIWMQASFSSETTCLDTVYPRTTVTKRRIVIFVGLK